MRLACDAGKIDATAEPMNQVTDKIKTGTLGELLVQIRLLQFGVQAAPPIKDSGNDLIAINGHEFRAISVRTTTSLNYNKPNATRFYHILAVVRLVGDDRIVALDTSEVFLIPQTEVASAPTRCDRLEEYKFTRQSVEAHFGALAA